MAAQPADLLGDGMDERRAPSDPADRLDYIRCQTDYCRAPLAVREANGSITTHLLAAHHPDGTIDLFCPYCKAKRTWTPRKPARTR